jgi:hypothetical protein
MLLRLAGWWQLSRQCSDHLIYQEMDSSSALSMSAVLLHLNAYGPVEL